MLKAMTRNILVTCTAVLALAGTAQASDPKSCKAVRFAMVDWADILATTAAASEVLEGLGYQPTSQMVSVSVAFLGLQRGDADVFLGNWMPAQESTIKPVLEDGSVEVVRANLEGAKFTLAVPRYVAEDGLTDYQDIAKFKDKLDGKIYGIGAGSDGNRHIQEAMDDLGLKDFKLVASSEAGMLSQVGRAVRRNEWIVFLAWEPHPMNTEFDIVYLDGGDKWFGPNYGGATVHTVVRKGYLEECPNVGKFLKNLEFSLAMENQIMAAMEQGKDADEAAVDWLRENPEVLDGWLKGVTTFDGGDALPAVRNHLGL